MMVSYGRASHPKYITFIYGKEWDRGDFSMLRFVKTPLGWCFNIWRLVLSYNNYENVNKYSNK